MEEPRKNNIIQELGSLFDPRSVVVIGATSDWNKWGFSTFSCALDGFGGPVYPVNNRKEKILGHKSYARVTDIPGEVDLAIFVIPSTGVVSVMEDCVAKGVKAAVIITAGFAEIGEEGKKLQDEVLGIARRGGIRFVGPNCMGFWSASSNIKGFMWTMPIRPGPLGFVTQGGNIGGAVAASAYEREMGFHRYVSCGCAADIPIEDYIEYFGHDPEVKVILTYIEGVTSGERFIRKVREVSKVKPVIALKPGRTEAAAIAIRAHSGALAGADEIYEEAFKKAGIVRADSPEELLDTATAFLSQPIPRGRNVAITTPGGSYGVLCADYCAQLGLNVVKLPERTLSELDKMFPPRWSHGNPVDPAGDRNIIAYLRAPETLVDLDEVDSLIFMGFGSFSGFGAGFAQMAESGNIEFPKIEWPNPANREEAIQFFGTFTGFLFGGGDPKAISDATRMARIVVESGETDFLDFQPVEDSDIMGQMNMLTKTMDYFLAALILHWSQTRGKPIVTTTFSEIASYLNLNMGLYYSYPTPQRAAKVLSKLVQYGEYRARLCQEG
ncbi:MAG: CoA-binding protein [Chloroflexota bacterium]|nr:CoA-binding protein [Chloroflexota bacterium]